MIFLILITSFWSFWIIKKSIFKTFKIYPKIADTIAAIPQTATHAPVTAMLNFTPIIVAPLLVQKSRGGIKKSENFQPIINPIIATIPVPINVSTPAKVKNIGNTVRFFSW